MADILYKNPPLVEVICEIHWQLQPLQALDPHAKLDPHFPALKEDVDVWAAKEGFTAIEEIQDPRLPREFRPYAPETRYRRGPGEWPLFQIGPGIFAVNTVPPYSGWSKFGETFAHFLGVLYKTYPLPERYLKISQLEIRYLNAFDNRFGYSSYSKFASESLTMVASLPDRLVKEHLADGGDIEVNQQIAFPLKSPANAMAVIQLGTGLREGVKALLTNLLVRENIAKPAPMKSSDILVWFDQAHAAVRDVFDSVLTDATRERMQPQEE